MPVPIGHKDHSSVPVAPAVRLAAAISRSISASVRYSRVRSLQLGSRLGVTVRFTEAGVTSLRCDLAMCFTLTASTTVRTTTLLRTVVHQLTPRCARALNFAVCCGG
jgi:hypothetical protein